LKGRVVRYLIQGESVVLGRDTQTHKVGICEVHS
uniref:Histidine phosphatase family protein n=1 Tax=Gongylonema pulchrum TaxID=637853 RepID=A0A183DK72_9BILA